MLTHAQILNLWTHSHSLPQFQNHSSAGLSIWCISSDQEFQPVLQYFTEATPYIDFNLAKSNEHVPKVEQRNHFLQEWKHATFHSRLFQAISTIFLRYLVSETTEKLHFVPLIGGISPYHSPHQTLTNQHLNYEKHWTILQFRYVQAHDEPIPKSTQVVCKFDCI